MRATHRRTLTLVAAGGLVTSVVLIAPGRAEAAVHAPAAALVGIPNPFDLGLPSPSDLIGAGFKFVFRTFFGLEAKVTQRAVTWLLATPVYSDTAAYAQLNRLRSSLDAAAWALWALVFTVAGVRYYASGFTSAGSYEAIEALTRAGAAAGALALYPQAFGALCLAANYLTYGITHSPEV